MAGDRSAKETKKAAGDAPKTKAKRKNEGKEESERPKKAAKAEKAAAAPKPKAEPASKSKGKKSEEGGKAKKEKKVKDPNAPKKNLTAFMYFSNGMRDKVKTDNPGVSFGEVGKLLGEKWKSLSSDEKAEYDEMAKKDKERYAKELEAYKEKGGNGAAAPSAKPKSKAKAPAPKKEEEEEEEEEDDEPDDVASGDEDVIDD